MKKIWKYASRRIKEMIIKEKKKLQKNCLEKERSTVHMPQHKARVCGCAPLRPNSPPSPRLFSPLALSRRRLSYRRRRRPTPGVQLFVGPFPGTEHPPGMPPSPPLPLCESEHLKPNLSYLAICNRIWYSSKCIHVLIMPSSFDFF